VVTAYLKRREQGEQPDRQLILADYPLLAGPLMEFFTSQDALEVRTATLRELSTCLANRAEQPVLPRHEPADSTVTQAAESSSLASMDALPYVEDYQIE